MFSVLILVVCLGSSADSMGIADEYIAVQTGLQRHCPPEFLDQVAEWKEAGGMFGSFAKCFDSH